jgi:hypothetical protein
MLQATDLVNSETLRAPREAVTLFRESYSSSERRKLTILERRFWIGTMNAVSALPPIQSQAPNLQFGACYRCCLVIYRFPERNIYVLHLFFFQWLIGMGAGFPKVPFANEF